MTMRHGVQIDHRNYKIRHYLQVLWFYFGEWIDLKRFGLIVYRTIKVKKHYGLLIRSSRAPSFHTIIDFKTIELIRDKRNRRTFITGNEPKLNKIIRELEMLKGIQVLKNM